MAEGSRAGSSRIRFGQHWGVETSSIARSTKIIDRQMQTILSRFETTEEARDFISFCVENWNVIVSLRIRFKDAPAIPVLAFFRGYY